MASARRIWPIMLLLGIAGAAIFIALVVGHGAADIGAAFATAGWGVALVVAIHVVPLMFDTLSWQALIPRGERPTFRLLLLFRWIGDSVSSILPVAQVGGEIVRVRLAAARHGGKTAGNMPLPLAVATVVGGMTASVATQILFTLSGLFVLSMLVRGHHLMWPLLSGAGIGVLAVGGFYAVQHWGIFRIIGGLAAHVLRNPAWQANGGWAQRGAEFDEAIRTLYARRRAVAACCLWTMIVWVTDALEVVVALAALGYSPNFAHAFVLESMTQAIRSAAFLVPAALGFQEGGYVVIGALLGISPADCMALALIRRVRELAFGVPGVLAWQWLEGFAWWKRHSMPSETASVNKGP